MLIDPLGAAVQAIFAYRDEKKKERWAVLILSISFSDMITFLFVTGTTLLASHSWLIAFGTSFIACSGITLALLLRSDLSKELTLVLNRDTVLEYQKEANDGLTTINPTKKV